MAVELKPKDVAPLRSDTHVAVCVRRHFLLKEDWKKKKKERASIASEGWEGHTHTAERKFKTCVGRELTVTDERENKVNPTDRTFF